MRKSFLVLNILLLLLSGATIITAAKQPQVKTEELIKVLPARTVYTGAWVGGFWDSKSKTLDVSKLRAFENSLDTKLAIANVFSEWTYLSNPDFQNKLREITSNGWTPMISANPMFFDKCKKSTGSIYATIARGDCDEFLREGVAKLNSINKPILLRFAWEMNLPSIWWSVEKTNSTPGEFREAWKHLYSLVQENPSGNIKLVLSFNTSSSKTIPYAKLYPGDDYTDWVAIDGYNWGTSVKWSKWTSFDGVFKKSYEELTRLTAKPIMLSEVNSSSVGGNKAAWFDEMLNVKIPYEYRGVKAVVFFNENKSQGEGVDWRVEESQDNLFIVRSALKNRLYTGTFR